MGIAVIALVINLVGLFRLLMAQKMFLSGWYKIILKGIVVIVVFLNLFIIVDVVNDYVFYFAENMQLYQQLNLVLFILALLTALSLVGISIINLKIAKEHGFR